MIEDEAQLRLIILNIHKNNDFKNFLKMSLFYKMKFLNQSSMLFSVQYRMINVIDFMISKLFYANQITNDERTFIVNRFLSRAIINYFTKTYNVSSFVMLLQVKEKILKNNTHSLYNLINASTIFNLMIKMIERNVMQSREMFIIIFYRAQFKLYKQILRNLSLMKSKLLNIQVRIMNFMQECQKSFIFLDLMICQKLNFMRIKNRVNVTCFRTEHVMMIIDDIDQIMMKRLQLRQYFDNVFNHVKLFREFVTSNDTKRNLYLSFSLSWTDVIDQSNQSIVNVVIDNIMIEFENDNEKISTKDFNENNIAFKNWVISKMHNNWNDS
jgi:hypothetical protein